MLLNFVLNLKIFVCSLGIFCVTLLISFASLYTEFAAYKPGRSEYDYIIGLRCKIRFRTTGELQELLSVGAGTAGTTVLNGIAEGSSVLLIEAGGIPAAFMDVPVMAPLIHGTRFDWGYETIPQKNSCKSLNKRKSRWSAGKGYGGSNILNNMVSHRGHKEDFRGWFGAPQSYDYARDILPYFKKFEDMTVRPAGKDLSKFGQIVARTLDKLGIRFSVPELYRKNGWRWTMAHHAYENLKSNQEIFTGALVTELLFERGGASSLLPVRGVQILKSGEVRQIKARKGVILAAGAIGSPKILMQSGIGPCDHLASLGIECRINLPVGDNLQDHVATGLDLITLNTSLGLTLPELLSFRSIKSFIYEGDGALSFGGCEVLGFLENDSRPPELGFIVMPVGLTADLGISLRHVINLNAKWWEGYFQFLVTEGRQTVSILPVVLHPKSRGSIRLRSSDPLDQPIIDPRYFENQEDVETLVRGLKFIDKLVQNSDGLQQLGAKVYEKSFPGCEEYKFKSDEYWECYARHFTLSVYHPAGTCKLGDSQDRETVVTRDYRVVGTSGLYVVDGSTLPHLPSGNPNTVIAMLAQRFVEKLESDQAISVADSASNLRDEL